MEFSEIPIDNNYLTEHDPTAGFPDRQKSVAFLNKQSKLNYLRTKPHKTEKNNETLENLETWYKKNTDASPLYKENQPGFLLYKYLETKKKLGILSDQGIENLEKMQSWMTETAGRIDFQISLEDYLKIKAAVENVISLPNKSSLFPASGQTLEVT